MPLKSKMADRERGTPHHNPLKHPRVLLGVVAVFCTVASTLVCGFDLSDRQELVCTLVGTALGSISSLVAIVNADSSIHAEGFGWAVFLSAFLKYQMDTEDTYYSILTSLKLAGGPIAVALFSPLPPVPKALSPLGAFVNPLIISTTVCIPMLSLVAGSILMILQSDQKELPFAMGIPAAIGIATQILYILYYTHRSHKHGSLLVDKEMKGIAVATAYSIALTIQMAASIDNATTAILPVLIGSLLATLLCAIFASVADVWYPVGTGQFLMVSTDTASFLFYFVSPCIILLGRFVTKYGDSLSTAMALLVKSALSGLKVDSTGYPVEDLVTFGTLFLVGAGTMVGVPLVNALCPLGAHLFGWAYTHGQPSTKKIALCVSLSDILNDTASPQQNQIAVHSLCEELTKNQESTVNIFVTHRDLVESAAAIKDCAVMGHCIGIAADDNDVLEAYNEYERVLKLKPKWYHVGPKGGCSSRTIAQVTKLGMKIVYWSTHVAVMSLDYFTLKQMGAIRSDVLEQNGGSIIYLQRTRGDENDMTKAIQHVIKELSVPDKKQQSGKEGYKFAVLSLVARDESPMDL